MSTTINFPTLDSFFDESVQQQKYCLNCDQPIKNYGIKFCCHSCSASFNNKGKIKSKETIEKLRNSMRISVKAKLARERAKVKNKEKRESESINVLCYVCGINSKTVNKKYRHKFYCEEITCTKQKYINSGKSSAASRKLRSADEIKLFELCSTKFECLSNHIICDGWDADIIIPSHKLAILWNGPWHYKEMNMKNHSLNQVQNRDRIKTKLFTELGWTVLVFEDRYYTPQTAFEKIKEMVEAV